MQTLRKTQSSTPVVFADGHIAQAARIYRRAEIPAVLREIGLQGSRPTLVIVGGASQFNQTDKRVQGLFTEVLAPLAEDLGAVVVDGGTDAGVMQLMGRARSAISATFPLVGVVPNELVQFPNDSSSEQTVPLEPNHTHFLFVPGLEWGDESSWLAWTASALARHNSSVTVLVNGGKISLVDVQLNLAEGRPIAVVEGSGRLADEIATALRHPEMQVRSAISPLLQRSYRDLLKPSLNLSAPVYEIKEKLRNYFNFQQKSAV